MVADVVERVEGDDAANEVDVGLVDVDVFEVEPPDVVKVELI